MNVKVSKRALENALRMLLQEAPDPQPSATASPTTASPSNAPVDPPATPPSTPPAEKPPEPEKTLEQKFDEKVKSLESAPEGQTLAVGNVKFVKRGGKWELSSSGDKGAIDKETLLGIVSDAAQEDILKKIAADDKSKGTLGVTVRGDQFIETTEKAANFVKDDKGYYRDITPVPVQILAQYVFQTETGEDTGAVRASLARSAGEAQLVYRTDKLMYVIDPGKGDIYILSIADNVDNPLQATSNLLDQLDKEGRIASTGSTLKGFKRKTNADQLLTSLQNIRKFLKPAGDGTPFDVRIRDFQFVGDLQKALSARRTLFSKFVDLFQVNELEMSFVYSPWGPAFKRARVLGSRGGAGGAGALSGTDMDALKATGLFTEESLPNSVGGKYIPDFRQELIDEPGPGEIINPVNVRKSGAVTGAEITGVDTLGNALTQDYGDFYEPTYADAYFLYSNGALKAKEAPQPEEAPPAPAAPPSEKDPMDEVFARVGTPLGDPMGAVFFKFNSDQLDVEDPANYLETVINDLTEIINKIPGVARQRYESLDAKFCVSFLTTADPTGEPNYNDDLSVRRAKVIQDKVRVALSDKKLNDIVFAYTFKLGENPWKSKHDQYLALGQGDAGNDKRKWLRFSKAYFDVAQGDKSMSNDRAVELAVAFGDAKLAEKGISLPAAANEDYVRQQVRLLVRESLNKKNTH